MIKINFTWVPLLVMGMLAACQPQWKEALSTKQAREVMCKDTFASGWILKGMMDPYNPSKVQKPEKGLPPTLVFFGDGHYLSYDTYNHTTGTWFLNTSSDRIALIPGRSNGQDITPSASDSLFRYHILYQSTDSLVIGIQGRHGIVEEYYAKNR